jgi:hypothetical protein
VNLALRFGDAFAGVASVTALTGAGGWLGVVLTATAFSLTVAFLTVAFTAVAFGAGFVVVLATVFLVAVFLAGVAAANLAAGLAVVLAVVRLVSVVALAVAGLAEDFTGIAFFLIALFSSFSASGLAFWEADPALGATFLTVVPLAGTFFSGERFALVTAAIVLPLNMVKDYKITRVSLSKLW